MGSLDPQQQRDRQLAQQPRYGRRQAAPLADLVSDLMATPHMRRIKKHCHLTAAMAEVLPPALLARVRPERWAGNVLTLAVDGSPMLAEIRQFHQTALLNAFMQHGLGIARLRLQLLQRT